MYSLLHNSGLECEGPSKRRELLLRKFKEKHTPPSSGIGKLDYLTPKLHITLFYV